MNKALSLLDDRVVSSTVEKLQAEFDALFPDQDQKKKQQQQQQQHADYARSFVEYCCFKAISALTQYDYDLLDSNFHRYTFDCMVAWEAPTSASELPLNETLSAPSHSHLPKVCRSVSHFLLVVVFSSLYYPDSAKAYIYRVKLALYC